MWHPFQVWRFSWVDVSVGLNERLFWAFVTAWPNIYIVEGHAHPLEPPSLTHSLLKSVAWGRHQGCNELSSGKAYTHHRRLHLCSALGNLLAFPEKKIFFSRSLLLFGSMALRQDSDKEPSIELFIKVSCFTLKV